MGGECLTVKGHGDIHNGRKTGVLNRYDQCLADLRILAPSYRSLDARGRQGEFRFGGDADRLEFAIDDGEFLTHQHDIR